MFNINNKKTFKDSVHGYIDIPKCFVDNLIDNEYFQRLRNIEQTGMRVLYPNAKHDRFSHSIGVFHLGNRAVDTLLENFSKDQYWNIESDNQSILYWAKNKVLFLIACLLHDIGHAPFSHSLETQLLHNSKPPTSKSRRKGETAGKESGDYITNQLHNIIAKREKEYMLLKYHEESEEIKLDISKSAPHEQIGALMVFNDFFRNQIIKVFDSLHNDAYPRPEGENMLYSEYYQDKIVLDKVDTTNEYSNTIFWDDICFIARMIMGLKYDDWRPERQIRNCFIELLNGTNFDVDKLDYIVRDTQMSGINNISLDVDRLLNSLCIVTKTKHFNKSNLQNKSLNQTTILSIKNNDKDNEFHIDGEFQGAFTIKKGAEVIIEKGSKVQSFNGITQEEVKIKYKNVRQVKFEPDAIVYQDSEVVSKDNDENDVTKKIILLRGKSGQKPFSTSIKNATLLERFHFIAVEDVRLNIHENCNITIMGAFCSEVPIRLFNVKDLSGDISEVEILADTFKKDFTKTKVPGKNGYNVFSIGFKKQAINVIANVMDARNYLYLWIYAHHKVIYYANFLIPILAKELFPEETTDKFPNWSLDFENIRCLDDAYIWNVIRYKYCMESWKKDSKSKELKILLDELFTRKYKKSLYKSLAEYDLFFEKFDTNTKKKLQTYINDHLINTLEKTRPYIEKNGKEGKREFSVGYFKNTQIKNINDKLKDVITKIFSQQSSVPIEYQELELTELVYVSAEYKRKQLETLTTFIDMKDEITPISQIPLLESQMKKSISNGVNTYFYLYYQTKYSSNRGALESKLVKEAVKNYFEEIVETKIYKI